MKSWKGAVKAVARACARSTCSSPSTSRRTRSPGCSEGEEDGLMFALEVDAEGVPAVPGGSDQRRAAVRNERREHGIGGVRVRLVGEVDAGRDAVQQAAREDGDGDVRSFAPGGLR